MIISIKVANRAIKVFRVTKAFRIQSEFVFWVLFLFIDSEPRGSPNLINGEPLARRVYRYQITKERDLLKNQNDFSMGGDNYDFISKSKSKY